MHFSPTADQESLHDQNPALILPDDCAKLPDMLQYDSAAFRFLFHPFSFGIIGKPDDHILFLFFKKIKNLPDGQ